MRKRFQKGSLKKKNGSWIGQWRENGRFKSQALGRLREVSKAEALTRLAEILRPVNNREVTTVDFRTTFEEFLDGVFFPVNERRWKASTCDTTKGRIKFHIGKVFGEKRLSDINREELQTFLDGKANQGLSFSVVDHLRWDLSHIFSLARSEGAISRDPTGQLVTPKNVTAPSREVMTMQDVKKCLEVLPLRERLVFKLATLGGMRPGEILALKWKHINGGTVTIQQRVYRGQIDTPKTRQSKRDVALSEGVVQDIDAWRDLSLDDGPEAWVFPSELNTPLSRDNCWRRDIQPKLKEVGLGWASFQVVMPPIEPVLRRVPASS